MADLYSPTLSDWDAMAMHLHREAMRARLADREANEKSPQERETISPTDIDLKEQ